MKNICRLLFGIGLVASLFLASPLLAAACIAGFAFTENEKFISELSFVQIVPGKYITPEGEEVPYMTRAEKALFDQLITLGRGNIVTLDAIKSGAISFDPISYYIRAIITGSSGRLKILGPSTLNYVGITNFPNQAVLPQYYNFCFDRVAVRYAVATSANANAASITGWSSIRGSMPAALGNGELIILSNKNAIVETPISDFTSVAAVTSGGERDNDGGVLEKPRFFLEMIQAGLDINFATGQTVPSAANNTYAVEVQFYGVQCRLKY